MKRATELYGQKLQYRGLLRYLGAQLTEIATQNIVSDDATSRQFMQKLRYKMHEICYKLKYNYQQLEWIHKIRLVKCFFLAYTEIYAQILPQGYMSQITATADEVILKLLCEWPDKTIIEQFRAFIGIPSPVDRWLIVKLM